MPRLNIPLLLVVCTGMAKAGFIFAPKGLDFGFDCTSFAPCPIGKGLILEDFDG